MGMSTMGKVAFGKLLGMAMIVMMTSACSNPWAEDRPSQAEMSRANWLDGQPQVLGPRYCYRTLARVDCYETPLPGAVGRRVGSFDAPLP